MPEPETAALVTGAARGIGLAIARRLAEAGHHAILLDILGPEVEAAAAALRAEGLQATALPLDLADEQALSALPTRLGPLFERMAVLVNNAGISPKRNGRRFPAADLPLDQWNLVLRTNLTAPFRCIQLLLPPMRARRHGRIINIASRAGRSPGGVASADYVTTKTALLGLTRAFAKELAADGITVNAIAPGRIETPMTEGSAPEVIAAAVAAIPVGRIGTPDDIAALAAFLAAPEAGFITGATVDSNGGVLMI